MSKVNVSATVKAGGTVELNPPIIRRNYTGRDVAIKALKVSLDYYDHALAGQVEMRLASAVYLRKDGTPSQNSASVWGEPLVGELPEGLREEIEDALYAAVADKIAAIQAYNR